jgi:DNA-binding CsgD family transcriptional regulator
MIFIVLTNNIFLYHGVANTLGGAECYHLRFSAAPDNIHFSLNDRVTLIVDDEIFRYGGWSGLGLLMQSCAIVECVWLTNDRHYNMPACCEQGYTLSKHLNIQHVHRIMQAILRGKFHPVEGLSRIKMPSLTAGEKEIFRYVMSGKDVAFISALTSLSKKTIYSYKLNIAAKYGMKSFLPLQHLHYLRKTNMPERHAAGLI